jgi:hypothetical protein
MAEIATIVPTEWVRSEHDLTNMPEGMAAEVLALLVLAVDILGEEATTHSRLLSKVVQDPSWNLPVWRYLDQRVNEILDEVKSE